MRMAIQPSLLPAGERRVALLSAWIFDAFTIEGLGQPFVACQFSHADWGAEFAGYFGEHCIALTEQKIAGTFSGSNINAHAAPTHLQHHRQKIAFEPIGETRVLAVEDRVKIFE